MKRIDALKLITQLMYEVPEDPAWEYLLERAGCEPDEIIDEMPVFPGILDVYEALTVTPEELDIIEPHLNPIIKEEFEERYRQNYGVCAEYDVHTGKVTAPLNPIV